jgi:hypothetical protein
MLRLLALLPAAGLTVGIVVFSLMELAGYTPMSLGPPRNIAEAAALGNGSDILRYLRSGQDPLRVWPVRPEIISSTVTRATGLEAAVWSRKAQVVELFDRQGRIPAGEPWRRVYCLASDLPVDEILEYLKKAGTATCEPGQTVESVLARSKQP